MERLFVYGSLMEPSLMTAIAGRALRAHPAALPGYRRTALRNRWYPGIVRDPASRVPGLLYSDLDSVALARLDAYEGSEYERRAVVAELADGSQFPAWCFCLKPGVQWKQLPTRFDEKRLLDRCRKLARQMATQKRSGARFSRTASELEIEHD